MNLKRTLTIVLLIFSISTPIFAVLTPDQTKEARRIWLNGYDYFDKGSKALDSGQLRQAHTLFKESIKIFNDIKTKYPGWSSSMIGYRLKLCKSKIEQVEKLLASKNIKLTDTDVDKENIVLKKDLKKAQEDLKLAKRKLSITLISLEAARREAARTVNSSDDIEKIIKEKTELEKRYALLADRNKKMEIEAGPLPSAGNDEMKKSLDVALLKIEELSKANAEIQDKLEKERKRFTKVANENIQLKYEYKILQGKNDATVREVDKLNGKIAEHNEIIARWEKEKSELKTKILNTKNELLASKSSEETLKTKLDEIRKCDTGDTIIEQLKNENELFSKDLELVHLQLAKELKLKKTMAEEKKITEERLARVEKNLTATIQEKEKSSSDLEMFKKKLAINDTIIKKQDAALAKQKQENARLQKELKTLADKYKNIDKKEREFTALAKESLKVENTNRSLKRELADTEKKNKVILENMKKSEVKMVQMQKDLQDLISQNAKQEKEHIIAQDKLKKKLTDAIRNNIKLSSTIETNKKKITMLTEELVTVNTILEKRDKEIASLTDQVVSLNRLKQQQTTIKEPKIAAEPTADKNLQLENRRLSAEVSNLKNKITALKEGIKNGPETKKTVSPNPEKIKKMLNSAFNAEENGKKEAASWYYEKVLALDHENNIALTRLGLIKAGNGNYDDAVKLMLKGLKNDPDDVEKLQVLAVCYIRTNQFYKALGVAAKANANAPKDPKTQRYLGIICSNLGWKKAAEGLFRESFKLDPTSPETAFNAAVLLASNKKRIKEAKLWYEKAIKLGAERDPGIEKVLKTAK